MTDLRLGRRGFLGGTAAVAISAATSARASGSDSFGFEITRSEEEWRALLTEDEYAILRNFKTERPGTSPLKDETRAGVYRCKGCDLPLYDSRWKVPLDKGWVFFRQSRENAMLMSIEKLVPDEMAEAGMVTSVEPQEYDEVAATEVHCRRCGSHIGHILIVGGPMLHCSNGTAMDFVASEA